jgi:hypothetical protein
MTDNSKRTGAAIEAYYQFLAAEARHALSEIDRDMGLLFANLAAATWIALDGPCFFEQVFTSLSRWSAT